MYKLHLDGTGEELVLDHVLNSLKLSYKQFLCLCILAGCDYLQNIRGIGVHRAMQMVSSNGDDFMSVLEKHPSTPTDYRQKFLVARMVFLHQTVVHPTSRKTVPSTVWEDTSIEERHQFNCGEYPLGIGVNETV